MYEAALYKTDPLYRKAQSPELYVRALRFVSRSIGSGSPEKAVKQFGIYCLRPICLPFYCPPRINGKPSPPPPITTVLAPSDFAKSLVASIPCHLRS